MLRKHSTCQKHSGILLGKNVECRFLPPTLRSPCSRVAPSQSSLTVRFTISEERIKLGLRAGGAKNTQSSAKWTPLRWIRDPESPGRGKETPTPGSPIAGKFAPVAPQLSLKVAAVQSLCTIQLPVQPQCVPFYLRPANCLATLRTV